MSKAHYFNVVQTHEGGNPMLSIVPNQWVQGDHLRWPSKNAFQLSKDVSSKPAASWAKFPCEVKKSNIPTYEAAEGEAANLSGLSTDASDYAPRKKKVKKDVKTQKYDFNHMLDKQTDSNSASSSQPVIGNMNQRQKIIPKPPIIISQTVIPKSVQKPAPPPGNQKPSPIPVMVPSQQKPPVNTTQHFTQHVAHQSSSSNQPDIIELSQSEIDALLQNSQQFNLDSQIIIDHTFPEANDSGCQNATGSQNGMGYQIGTGKTSNLNGSGRIGIDGGTGTQGKYVMEVEHITDSDKIIEVINKKVEQECRNMADKIINKVEDSLVKMVAGLKSEWEVKFQAVLRANCVNDATDSAFKLSPASTVDEIKQLENDLADEAYQEKVINHLRKKIGPNGDSYNGQNSCYKLVDYFFKREVMVRCSWSGGSRSDTPKFAIKDCKNILEVFFTIIHRANPSFTTELMENFLKQVLRNAKTRCQSKGLRQSTIHRRLKGRKEKKQHAADPNADESTLSQNFKVEALDLDYSARKEEEDADEEYEDGEDANQNEEDADEEYEGAEDNKENEEDDEDDDARRF